MPVPKWSLSGEYMESCNCDYLCPCIYTNPQAPVTYDHCTAALVFRIDAGSCGDARLDGIKFALVIRSGKVMADGNWIFAGVVDESDADVRRRRFDIDWREQGGCRVARRIRRHRRKIVHAEGQWLRRECEAIRPYFPRLPSAT